MNIINEYDVVPRADRPYIRSLVDLYRSRYGLPPISDDAPLEREYRVSLDLSSSNDGCARRSNGDNSSDWSLPKPELHLIGDIILLKTALKMNVTTDGQRIGETFLKAVKVSSEQLGRLLFCSTAVHRKLYYADQVKLISGRASSVQGHGYETDSSATLKQEIGHWGKAVMSQFEHTDI